MTQCPKSPDCTLPVGASGVHMGRCNMDAATVCTCSTPVPVKLGAFGAFECATCRRCIIVRDPDPTPAHGLVRPLAVAS